MAINWLLAWGGAYILGSLPSGMLWAWVAKRIDVREHGSGRTGGTNVWRTAGFIPAFLTAFSDGLKGAAALWLARGLQLNVWGVAIAGTLAVVGHNYSLFLKFKGGAGTGTSIGVASVPWIWNLPILLLAGVAAGLLVGHASVASILIAILLPILFGLRGDVAYAVGFGVPTMLLTLWALRPNIQRLAQRAERFLPIYVNKPPLIRLSRHPAKNR
ncbi:MAG TPA: glycerol-3-phosphate acyltransferase [Anaerolineae bacterium]|nr:glycerol-3-phosphate acyltransferase [Anaerolineae bacterium]